MNEHNFSPGRLGVEYHGYCTAVIPQEITAQVIAVILGPFTITAFSPMSGITVRRFTG